MAERAPSNVAAGHSGQQLAQAWTALVAAGPALVAAAPTLDAHPSSMAAPVAWLVPSGSGSSASTGAAPQMLGSQAAAAFLQAQALPAPACSSSSQASPGNNCAHVYWTVNARQIHSKDTKVASPRFCIYLPNGPCPFQLMLYAEARSPKWGSSGFARSRGRGRIEIRCGAELPKGSGRVTFALSLGSQPPRPAVSHDFSQQACCGLRRWDFSTAVDPATGTFVVHLEILELGGPAPSEAAQGPVARRGGA